MTDVHAIIARCTRDGVTSWQNVAAQLGRSVDSVRAQFDPTYLRAHCWAPSREADPELELPVDENDMSSPYAKEPSLKERILKLLEVQSMSSEILSAALNSPRNSIRARLDRMLEDGLVHHDSRYPRTWSIGGQGAQADARAA